MLQEQPSTSAARISGSLSHPIDELGPIDLLVLEFSGWEAVGASLLPFIDLVERGFIRIFDLVIISKAPDGSAVKINLAGIGQHDAALVAIAGAGSGLLDQNDMDQAAALIQLGNSAALLLYEHRWEEPLMSTIRVAGAQVVASERVPAEAVLAALDAAEG